MTNVYIVKQNDMILGVFSNRIKALNMLFEQFRLLDIKSEINMDQAKELFQNKREFNTNGLDENGKSDYSFIMTILKKAVL